MLLVVLAALGLPACGARVAPYLGAGAGIGQGGETAVAGSVTGAPKSGSATAGSPAAVAGSSGGIATSSTLGSSPGNQAPSPSTTEPSSPAQLTQSNFAFDPATQAGYCTGTTGNTASAPGVSPTAITFGNVSGVTGPLTGTFGAGYEAVQAAFDGVNAAGGICGRKLDLLVENDNQDSSTNAADIANLIAHPVFAFAGSLSDADNGGVQEMVNAGVPDIGFALSPARSMAPVYWSLAGGSALYVRNGTAYSSDALMAGQKHFGQFPTRVALLSYNVPVSQQAGQMFEALYKYSGASICYSDFSLSVASASLQGDVIEMESNHCNGIYTTLDVVGNAKLLQAMQQQNFYPPFYGSTFDTYTPAQIVEAGQSAAQGFQTTLSFLPLNSSNPVVQLYVSELHRYEPGKQPSGFGLEDFIGAQMIIYALVKSGHNPTRASIVDVFRSINNWTVGGAVPPSTAWSRAPNFPGNQPPMYGLPAACSLEMVVKGNQFVRDWPAHGFYCGGGYVPIGPASSFGQ